MDSRKLTELFEKNHAIMHKIAEKMDLSFGKFSPQRARVLEALSTKEKIRLKDIASKIGMSSSSLCVIFSHMEKDGLVVREIDQNDRRNTFYSLSQQGQELHNEITEYLRVSAMKLFEPLSKSELKEMSNAVGIINDILERCLQKISIQERQ